MNMRGLAKNFLSLALFISVTMLTTGCKEFGAFLDNPVGSYLEVKNNSVTMTPGESYQIQASTISTEPITYESSDELVAIVDNKGMVTATGDGEAVITLRVAANDVYAAGTASFKVTVSRTDMQAPLTLVAKADGVITVNISNATLKEPLYYKILRKTKGALTATTDIQVKKGDKVEFTSKNKALAVTVSEAVNINPQVECSVYGNAMSLISPDSSWVDNTKIEEKNALTGLFMGAEKIVNDEERSLLLPATTLMENCYSTMFGGCTSLKEAPQLPSTTLAKGCYSDMFTGCIALTKAPQLPATTLAEYCYYNMFSSCKELTAAPDLMATSLVDFCYTNMFNDCSKLCYVKCMAVTGAKFALFGWLTKAGTDSSVTQRRFVRSAGNTNWTNSNAASFTADNWYVPVGWNIVTE